MGVWIMRYIEINNETKLVQNIIEWDGVSLYSPPNATLILGEDLPQISFGWKKTESGWEAPPPPPDEPSES